METSSIESNVRSAHPAVPVRPQTRWLHHGRNLELDQPRAGRWRTGHPRRRTGSVDNSAGAQPAGTPEPAGAGDDAGMAGCGTGVPGAWLGTGLDAPLHTAGTPVHSGGRHDRMMRRGARRILHRDGCLPPQKNAACSSPAARSSGCDMTGPGLGRESIIGLLQELNDELGRRGAKAEHLTVDVASAECLLAMKLFASRVETDAEDIAFLFVPVPEGPRTGAGLRPDTTTPRTQRPLPSSQQKHRHHPETIGQTQRVNLSTHPPKVIPIFVENSSKIGNYAISTTLRSRNEETQNPTRPWCGHPLFAGRHRVERVGGGSWYPHTRARASLAHSAHQRRRMAGCRRLRHPTDRRFA